MAFVSFGQREQKGGDKEAGENVRRESEREERALVGNNKEKEMKENGKRERKAKKGREKVKGGSGKVGERKPGKV